MRNSTVLYASFTEGRHEYPEQALPLAHEHPRAICYLLDGPPEYVSPGDLVPNPRGPRVLATYRSQGIEMAWATWALYGMLTPRGKYYAPQELAGSMVARQARHLLDSAQVPACGELVEIGVAGHTVAFKRTALPYYIWGWERMSE